MNSVKSNSAISPRRSEHFTLVELLIVIAIIAILASIMLPALRKAKEQSKSTFCKNNQKQIGLGMFMFINDNNDWIPIGHQNGSQAQEGPADVGFRGLRRGNYMTAKQWDCPSDTTRGVSTNTWNTRNGVWYGNYWWEPNEMTAASRAECNPAYLWNFYLGYWDTSTNDWNVRVGRRANTLKYPSNDIICGDGETHIGSIPFYMKSGKFSVDDYSSPIQWKRHQASINMLMADGHVVNMKRSPMLVYTNDYTNRDY